MEIGNKPRKVMKKAEKIMCTMITASLKSGTRLLTHERNFISQKKMKDGRRRKEKNKLEKKAGYLKNTRTTR